MKYKNFLLNTTQRNRENIQRLKTLIEKQTGKDITTNTRHRELVFARKIYYKILSSTTRMSYSSIAGTLGQHHATILHALNKFDWDYNHIPAFKEAYDRVYNSYTRNDTVVTIDTLTHENQILRETISKLKEELKQIRDVKASIKPRNQEATIYKSTV